MRAPAHVVIETVTHVTLFGLGLWDAATNRLVSDGMEVRIFRLAGTRPVEPVLARANRRGIFVARGVAGLRALEAGAGDDAFWGALPPPRPFLVEVRDLLERYTSFVVHVGLPAGRGLTVPPCIAELAPLESVASPPPLPVYVPLFGTAARTVHAGMTAVRATLVDAVTRRPAESAVLEVRESGRVIARGIGDARGEVAAVFAYPEPPAAPPSSPPGPAARPQPLAAQTWDLDISVRYRRDLPRYTPDPARPPLADLCDVIAQPPAAVTTSSPPITVAAVTLRYGEELVLGGDAGAELLISPA
jgi:hypothetical protein